MDFRDLVQPEPPKVTREEDVVSQHLARAMDAFERKEYQTAAKEMEAALDRKPDSQVARELHDQFLHQYVVRVMLSQEKEAERLKKAFRRFLVLSERGRREWIKDPAVIRGLLKDFYGDEAEASFKAGLQLPRCGQHAIPYLLDGLKSRKPRVAARTVRCLISIGDAGAVALAEALKTTDSKLVQELCFVFRLLRSTSAIPPLRAIVQDEKANVAVRRYARHALEIITGKKIGDLPVAPEIFLMEAEKYFYRVHSVRRPAYDDFVIWDWDRRRQELVGRFVPEYIYYLETAEKYCRDGLAANPNYEPLTALLVNVYAAQHRQVEKLAHVAIDRKAATKLTPDDRRQIQDRRTRLQRILRQLPSVGKKFYYAALRRSLNDGRWDEAAWFCDALGEMIDGSQLPMHPVDLARLQSLHQAEGKGSRGEQRAQSTPPTKPAPAVKGPALEPENNWGKAKATFPGIPMDAAALVEALGAPNQAVQYAAAMALARTSSYRRFRNMEKVVPLLRQALGERGAQVVLIAADMDTINLARQGLAPKGIVIREATEEAEVLSELTRIPGKDLLVLSLKFKAVLPKLRRDYRFAKLPVLVTGTKEEIGAARREFRDSAQGYLAGPLTSDMLALEISALLTKLSTPDSSGARAQARVARAAQAIAEAPLATAKLPFDQAIPALIEALKLPHDSIRLPAIQALVKLRARAAIRPLGLTAADRGASARARLASLDGIASIVAGREPGLSAEQRSLLVELLGDTDRAVQRRAANLLGGVHPVRNALERIIADPGDVGVRVTKPADLPPAETPTEVKAPEAPTKPPTEGETLEDEEIDRAFGEQPEGKTPEAPATGKKKPKEDAGFNLDDLGL